MIGRTTSLEGSQELNHARATTMQRSLESQTADAREARRRQTATNAAVALSSWNSSERVKPKTSIEHFLQLHKNEEAKEQKADQCQSSRLDTSSSSSSPPCSVRTRAKNTWLAKIRAGPYRKCEDRKKDNERERENRTATDSQPGKLFNAKRETEKLMCVKMKENKAPKIT
jgi:hypothetical protein